ncbi:succinylglutamate desuccinylase/aspartoacylase family protein [Roseomonas marmotae]|uniref:Succinylglutamate desuccinylase/aspartoacylase family protein n=2 Tax=Roseomonas marmotae TaxID=2768161 RepID=A0ABS3KFS5_9PROT|nr:succinylglutamate desuccinylase/aspartoacylase family protein [Roseomonas marmotae]MBO1076313.1 succinylglutamate desuccinylase/aspartoacylase family protein [Roseomonas marmotae]QTI80873.1 succinylglutamate desuccinylase/aspartoacylase family protein [Roseomonas marmotae]
MTGAGYLPHFPVRVPIPDLRPWLEGNRMPGVWSFSSPLPGPHVALVSLMHGNEIAGALLLARWLREGLRPLRGTLTMIFANLAAFSRFDPANPTLSRFVDEDLNRVWDDRLLKGCRHSTELARARALLPLMQEADVLLDLHSMLWPSDPLMIAGDTPQSRDMALRLGTPELVVVDQGHRTGQRLIDHPIFTAPGSRRACLLVEGGPHWEPATLETLEQCATALLRENGLLPQAPRPSRPGRLAEVTRTVIAGTHGFAFVQDFRGGTVIPARNTLLALDGEQEIRTPHDDCLLVMPTPRAMRGHTAVRLARFA